MVQICFLKKKINNFVGRPGFQKYFKNTGWLFLEKIIRIFFSLFVGVWIARYLGPGDYGLYNYAISFAGLFTVISTLGLDSILVKELVINPEAKNKFLGTAFVLKIIGAFLSLVFLACALFFAGNSFYENFLIFIVGSGVVFQSFNVIDFYFQSKVLSKYIVIANIIVLCFSSLIKIYLILMNFPLIYFVFVVLFDSFFTSIIYICFYKKFGLSIGSWSFDTVTAKFFLKSSWPLILASAATAIYMKIDQIMIKNMLNINEVGEYAAAVRLSEAWYFVPTIVSASLFPAIVAAKKHNIEVYNERLQKLYDFMFWTAMTIAIPISLLSKIIVKLLYGEEYIQAGSVLFVHIWAGIFVFIGVASRRWLINENLQIFSTINTFLGALINVILNYLLISRFGILGAAWSTLFSYFFAFYFSLVLFKQTRINFYKITKSFFIFSRFKDYIKYIKTL